MQKISLKSKTKCASFFKREKKSLGFYHIRFFSGKGMGGPSWRKIITFWLLIFSLGSLFSCGLANYNFGSSNSSATVLDSRSNDDSTGEFNSPKGRLESSDTCSKSEDCKELCDSMLQRFSFQKKCYEYKEVEVQSFRDVYNLLAVGNPRKLSRVDTEKMEKFLTFGPELWQDAIYGFERQRKEDCTPNDGADDPTEREDCKLEGYYKQEGYWSGGALAALEWIAKNDWLAELIVRHDEDLVIMTSLLDVLAHGGGKVFKDPDSAIETQDNKNKTCNLNLIELDLNANRNCDKPATANNEDFNKDNECSFKDSDFANFHGRLSPNSDIRLGNTPTSISVNLEKHYKAFGADCVSDDRENYFIIAVAEKNKNSLTLGHQMVDKLCSDDITCIRYFYCHIKNGFKQGDLISATDRFTTTGTPPKSEPKPAQEGTILHYMDDNKGSISGFRANTYNNCYFP